MNGNARARELTTVALAGMVGLMLATAPASAQQGGEEGPTAARAEQQPRQIQMKILGMSCPFCAYGVEQKLKRLDGVEELEVDLESGIATLTMEAGTDVPNERLRKEVEDAGFEASAIVRSFESEFGDWNPEEIPRATGGAVGSDDSTRTAP